MAMSTTLPELAQRLPATIVLLASSPAFAAPDADQAAPAIDHRDPEPLEALVVVRVELDGSDEVAALMHAEVVAALRGAGVDSELPEHAPLEITVSTDTESLGAYDVVYRHRGDVRESWSCQCTGDELRARLAFNAVAVWNTLNAASAPSLQTSHPIPTAALAPLAVDPGARQRERGLGLWIAGIATTGIGTGVVVGTSALLISDAAADRDRNPVTVGLMSASVAMVASGVTLWSIGAHRRKRPMLSALPTVRHRGVTFTVTARF